MSHSLRNLSGHMGRALALDQYSTIGGGQVVFLSSLEALSSHFSEVVAVIPPGPGGLHTEVEGLRADACGLSILKFRTPGGSSKRHGFYNRLATVAESVARFVTLVLEIKRCELVYVNGPRWLGVALLLAICWRAPLVLHVHLLYSQRVVALLRLIQVLHHRCYFFAASETIQQHLLVQRSRPWMNLANVRLVQNTLSKCKSTWEFDSQRQMSLGVRVGVFGRVCPEKGQHVLVEIAKSLVDIEFLVIGHVDAQDVAWYQKLTREAPPNVQFLREVSDMRGALRRYDINTILVPSVWDEPFGLTAIEGMAASCITLASGRGGLREIARKTQLILFKNSRELMVSLKVIESLSPETRVICAQMQFEAVMKRYHFSGYFNAFITQIRSIRNRHNV